MQTFELLPERPSPNVIINLPWAFDELLRLSEPEQKGELMRGFSCTVIDGVYVIDWENTSVLRTIEMAFDKAFHSYRNHIYNVDVSGIKNPEGRIGSVRFCTMSDTLARFFTTVIQNTSMFDYHPYRTRGGLFKQVSRYFRAMRYQSGGEHFPHYDTDFNLPPSPCIEGRDVSLFTGMSLVAYGNDCKTGEIAFVKPGLDSGNREDWERQATDEEIFLKLKSKVGRIVIFDHSICHSVLPFIDEGGTRRILRGDLIFQK